MRRFHRWFGLITGIFMALIAATGVGMQVLDLTQGDQHGGGGPPPAGQMQMQQAGPPGTPAGAPQGDHDGGLPGGMSLRQTLDHIHDGEFIGNTGRVLSLIFGLSLFFFSVSGIWMYWQMFKARAGIGKKSVFW